MLSSVEPDNERSPKNILGTGTPNEHDAISDQIQSQVKKYNHAGVHATKNKNFIREDKTVLKYKWYQ